MNNKKSNNYAFIDGQNLYKGVKKFDNDFSYKKFRVYLQEFHHIKKAIIFLGYIKSNVDLYKSLEADGFELEFKSVSRDGKGNTKGNVDVFLTVQALMRMSEYDKAVIVTSDGDFASLVEGLKSSDKFLAVISPEEKTCSYLLRKAVAGRITYIDKILQKLRFNEVEDNFNKQTKKRA